MAQGTRLLTPGGVEALIRTLRDDGYRVVGPTLGDRAIVYEEIGSIDDLPAGWTEEQDGGRYRLRARDDAALFGYAVGPASWKRLLFPPSTLLNRARKRDGAMEIEHHEEDPPPRHAFLGVRPCDLHAIAVQDRVFLQEGREDPTYAGRRSAAFIVAVNCGEPGGTCFCASMGTGPAAIGGYDLVLTELLDAPEHRFLAEAGTDRGREVLGALPTRPAQPRDEEAAEEVVRSAAGRMGREMPAGEVPDLLRRHPEHPRWDDVAARCLACTNCTMVCPTCFCSTVEDSTDLIGEVAERRRRWDSCFTLGFSEMGGGQVRSSTRARYRQWMTHKLSTWHDQFGTSGCVGCGRCITWCPVGIDITEEVGAIRADQGG